MKTMQEQFAAAWRVSTPIVAVTTPDPAATIKGLSQLLDGKANLLRWDAATGVAMLTEQSEDAYNAMLGKNEPVVLENPTEMLKAALQLPGGSVLFVLNLNRFWSENLDGAAFVTQAIWNLRDPFKGDRRMLVLLSPQVTLPLELQQDVLILDEPFPDAGQLEKIAVSLYDAAEVKVPAKDVLAGIVDAARGLAAFPAEQAMAMGMTRNGLDVEMLRERKLSVVEQTGGIKADRGKETFADVRGLDQIKKFFDGIFKGGKPPAAMFRIDEIEKLFGGLGQGGGPADNTGVTQDILGVWLRAMEDYDWNGILAVGVPGSGKSLISKTAGNTYGAQTFSIDTGAIKQSLLGETEAAIRNMVKMIYSIAADKAFFVATCNDLSILPAALRRRFRAGIWYFDLPTKEEREQIWPVYLSKFGLLTRPKNELIKPDDEGWTGAEIRNVCDLAWQLGCSLKDAAQFIVPICKADKPGIEALRQRAYGNFLSATHPGPYRQPKQGVGLQDQKGRRMLVSGNN